MYTCHRLPCSQLWLIPSSSLQHDCLRRWEAWCDIAHQERSLSWTEAVGSGRTSDDDGLGDPPEFASVCGLELPRMTGRGGHISDRTRSQAPLVLTASTYRNLESAALALCMGRPLLLEGPPGAGKSALVEELAQRTGHDRQMLRIHLDDQMDSKSLLGAYVTTQTPGEFVWQAGPLTQAVQQGRWLLIEDINLAPPEVLAALVPLMESRELHLPQRAQTIRAAPGFQLIASVTSAPSGAAAGGAYASTQAVKDLLGGLWSYVAVEPPTEAESLEILRSRFSDLAALLPWALESLTLVRMAWGQLPWPVVKGENTVLDHLAALLEAAGIRRSELGLHVGRHLSLRDLVKWSRRMTTVQTAAAHRLPLVPPEDISMVSVAAREAAVTEFADILAICIPKVGPAGDRQQSAAPATSP